MARSLITLPARARRGDVIEVRCLIAHPMETGYRADDQGRLLPADLIRRFSCHYNGALVFSAELHAAIAANPLLVFALRAQESGSLVFEWQGDKGFAQREQRELTVVP
jgi:sulfur-oxidizing protein SoxZ